MEEMLAVDAVLGGEDSGHMIFLDYHSTGDGLLAAIRLLTALSEEPVPLSQRSKIMTIFPQVLINVDVSSKPNFETLPEVTKAITAAESRLGADGRVLVRYSGTQPQCRIMVEGPDMDIAKSECRAIADIIQNTIGAGNE
jgi:phosphoglucosamine mutase